MVCYGTLVKGGHEMNRKYIPVYMEIVEFETEDVIVTSDAEDDTSGEDGEDDF